MGYFLEDIERKAYKFLVRVEIFLFLFLFKNAVCLQILFV